MTVELVNPVAFDENNFNKGPEPQSVLQEVINYLPIDMISNVTILVQSSGYITIKPIKLTRSDWSRLELIIRRMGGIWISNNKFSHWSIPMSTSN
jgi:hypothetical protein